MMGLSYDPTKNCNSVQQAKIYTIHSVTKYLSYLLCVLGIWFKLEKEREDKDLHSPKVSPYGQICSNHYR